jgi:hypothetical protein
MYLMLMHTAYRHCLSILPIKIWFEIRMMRQTNVAEMVSTQWLSVTKFRYLNGIIFITILIRYFFDRPLTKTCDRCRYNIWSYIYNSAGDANAHLTYNVDSFFDTGFYHTAIWPTVLSMNLNCFHFPALIVYSIYLNISRFEV